MAYIHKCILRTTVTLTIVLVLIASSVAKTNLSSRRQLEVDVSQSEVTGTGIVDLEAFQTATVQVTAKDSGGNLIGTGGEIMKVELRNECTLGVEMSCTEVPGAKQVFTSPVVATMTDNNDGTYVYTYSIPIDGTITVLVYQEEYIVVDKYASYDFTGTPETEIMYDLNLDWSGVQIAGGLTTDVTAIFYVTLIPPTTDVYYLEFYQNDDARVYFEGVMEYEGWIGDPTTGGFSKNLIANQRYSIEVHYRQDCCTAWLYMSWSTATMPLTIVPASAFTQKNAVGSGSYDLTVTCPDGYTGDDPSSPTVCVTECGNGYVTFDELCDDGNVLDGDGCSADCQIVEDCFNCVTDVNNFSACSNICETDEELEANASVLSYVVLGLIATGAILTTASSLISGSSPSGAFSMINSVQILLLLPFAAEFMPQKIIDFIYGLAVCLGSFGFVPLSIMKFISQFTSWLDVEQDDNYLSLMGLESRSTFVNIYAMIGVFLIIPFIHILILPCYLCTKRKKEKKFCTKVTLKIFHILTMSAYIRFLMEVYLLMLLASVSEMYHFDRSKKNREFSFATAIGLFTFCFLCMLISFCFWISTARYSSGRIVDKIKLSIDTKLTCMNSFREIFNGIKDKGSARSFCMLFCLRRMFLVIILIVWKSSSVYLRMAIFMCVQVPYFLIICILRPFSETKDNICEITNEVLFCFLSAVLFLLKSESDWTNLYQDIYIWLIVANNIFGVILSIIVFIKSLRKKKKENESKAVEPKVTVVACLKDFKRSESEIRHFQIPKSDCSKLSNYKEDVSISTKNIQREYDFRREGPSAVSDNASSIISMDAFEKNLNEGNEDHDLHPDYHYKGNYSRNGRFVSRNLMPRTKTKFMKQKVVKTKIYER